MVSDEQLRSLVEKIVRTGDLTKLTKKTVRQQCELKFGLDLTTRKKVIYDHIKHVVELRQREEDLNGAGDAGEAGATASAAKPKTKKRKPAAADDSAQKKKKRKSAPPKPQPLSTALAQFVGKDEMVRHEVVKFINQYAKKHGLVIQDDRRYFVPDERLRELLAIDQPKVGLLEVNKYLSPHFPAPKRTPSSGKGGFHALKSLSPALKAIVDQTSFSTAVAQHGGLSRPHIVKALWEYIKANNLQREEDRKSIQCNELMMAVFGVGIRELAEQTAAKEGTAVDHSKLTHLSMFTMNRFLGAHLFALPIPDAPAAAKPSGSA